MIVINRQKSLPPTLHYFTLQTRARHMWYPARVVYGLCVFSLIAPILNEFLKIFTQISPSLLSS